MQHAATTARRNETPDEGEGSALPGISNDGRNLTLAAIERQTIEQRFKDCGGNREETAWSLGITVKTLSNKLKAYKAERARGNG